MDREHWLVPAVMNPYQSTEGSSRPATRRVIRLVVAALFVSTYLSSYLLLSRQGFAKGDQMQLKGLWFATPLDGVYWRWHHYPCVVVFFPLIVVDNLCGTGRWPCNEPFWGHATGRDVPGAAPETLAGPGLWPERVTLIAVGTRVEGQYATTKRSGSPIQFA